MRREGGSLGQQAMSLSFEYEKDEADPKKRRQQMLQAKKDAVDAEKEALGEKVARCIDSIENRLSQQA